MADYKTKYKIGDLVYLADEWSYDRDVIKAIKIVGVSERKHYGFEDLSSGYFLFSMTDGYKWRTAKEIFKDKESAQAYHEQLATKKEAEEEKEKVEARKKRLAKLKEEVAALERGEDYDPDDDYDC